MEINQVMNNIYKVVRSNRGDKNKIVKELKLEHIDIAVYNKTNNEVLESLIYKSDNFDDNKDIVAKSDELCFVWDIVANICDRWGDECSEDLIEEGISYLAEIIIMDNKNQKEKIG